MLHKTKGIVLNYTKYRESSIIVRIYTLDFGLQSYIVNGVRSAKGRTKIALFQPLTLLDLVVYKNEMKDIQRISELKCEHPFFHIPFNQIKMSIGLFMAEIIIKVCREHQEDADLFTFIRNSILALDLNEEQNPDFHLIFLHRLLPHLGLDPKDLVDLQNELKGSGLLQNGSRLHTTSLIQLTLNAPDSWDTKWTKNNEERSSLLNLLTTFYQQHFNSFTKIKSIGILHEVLSN